MPADDGVLIRAGTRTCRLAPVEDRPAEPDTVTEDRGFSLRLESREVNKPANVSVFFQVRTTAGKPVPGLAVEHDCVAGQGADPLDELGHGTVIGALSVSMMISSTSRAEAAARCVPALQASANTLMLWV